MDYFDELENHKEEKEQFINTYNRNRKILRYVMGFVFLGLGLIFILLGIGLYFVEPIISYVFLPLGFVYFVLGIIFFIVFKKSDGNKAYQKLNDRINNSKPIYSSYEMSSRIIILENKIKKLEEETENLRKNSR